MTIPGRDGDDAPLYLERGALSLLLWNLILRPCCLTALKAYRQRLS